MIEVGGIKLGRATTEWDLLQHRVFFFFQISTVNHRISVYATSEIASLKLSFTSKREKTASLPISLSA